MTRERWDYKDQFLEMVVWESLSENKRISFMSLGYDESDFDDRSELSLINSALDQSIEKSHETMVEWMIYMEASDIYLSNMYMEGRIFSIADTSSLERKEVEAVHKYHLHYEKIENVKRSSANNCSIQEKLKSKSKNGEVCWSSIECLVELDLQILEYYPSLSPSKKYYQMVEDKKTLCRKNIFFCNEMQEKIEEKIS